MSEYTVAIYDQHTTLAGRWALAWDPDTDDAESDDYIVYEGTRDEILADANAADERAAQSGAGDDVFWRRVARSLREAMKYEE